MAESEKETVIDKLHDIIICADYIWHKADDDDVLIRCRDIKKNVRILLRILEHEL